MCIIPKSMRLETDIICPKCWEKGRYKKMCTRLGVDLYACTCGYHGSYDSVMKDWAQNRKAWSEKRGGYNGLS